MKLLRPQKLLLAALSLVFVLMGNAAKADPAPVEPIDWAAFLQRNDLTWTQPPKKWTESLFLGNGEIGAMIFHEPKNPEWVRVELSRSDLYNRNSGSPCFRCPTGHLYLKPAGKIQNVSYRLDLFHAEATGTITTQTGTISFRSFVQATEPLLRFEMTTSKGESSATCEYEAERAVNTRPVRKKEALKPGDLQPEPVLTREGDTLLSWQPFDGGGGAATAVRRSVSGATTRLAISLAVGWKDASSKADALANVARANAGDYPSALASHAKWWKDFYSASFLSLPDSRMESFYWIQLYKMASATRASAPAIDLMGPWFAPSIWLKYWTNLNIELTYWPQLTANHLELGESLVRMVNQHQDSLIKNAPAEWQSDSAAINGPAGPDLYSPFKIGRLREIGDLPFILQTLYWQYRYSMDDKMLRETLYPLLSRSINFYRHILVKEQDGKYHFPVGFSPEYEKDAADRCFDLSLCRWGAQTLIRSASRLKIDDPLIPVWRDLLASLTPYPIDEKTGYLIGKDVPLEHSHRHYSHLFMIFPLAICDMKGADRELVEKSIRHYLSMSDKHAGYTYAGAAAMAAYLNDGDQALARLNTLLDRYVKPNTMYEEAGGCPVIETPLSADRSIHEMTLQSWGDTIRVFPAIPAAWQDVAFRDFRTEGAFLVTARRKGGKTVYVRIQSLAGEPCKLQTGMSSYELKGSRPMAPHPASEPGVLWLPLEKGDWAEFYAKGESDFTIAPVQTNGPANPWGTVKK